MRRQEILISLVLVMFIFLQSCAAVPRGKTGRKGNNEKSHTSSSGHNVVKEAKSYLGTRYQYGGTTKRGLDCSGLVYNAFKENDVLLPRVSREQAKEGIPVKLSRVTKGDLLFFNTSGRGVSHVGIVERIEKGEIYFIHASSSKGVMISALSNSYWNPRFMFARRIL